MKKMRVILLAMALVLFVAANSWALVTGYVWQGQDAAVAAHNATLGQVATLGTADAMFYTADINYDSRVGGYTLSQFLHNPTFFNTSLGFNSSASTDDTFFYFTGSTYLHAGDNSFVVPHDDGLQLNIDGIGLVVNQPGPTPPTDTPFNVHVDTAGMYSFQLSYGECDGPPGVLAWTINGQPVNAPEPASMLLLGLGLVGLAGFRKRMK